MMKKIHCIFNLALTILAIAIKLTEGGILRNLITDRCIHVDKVDSNLIDSKLSVSARPCIFQDTKIEDGGNNPEWVEVIPTSKDHTTMEYIIQKYSQGNLVCVQMHEGLIKIGDCKSTQSILHINKVPEKSNPNLRPSHEKMFTGSIFTIEYPHSKKCLTVVPGTSELRLANCSQGNSFQRWISCRSMGACDVEISWSPARIIFPKGPPSNSSAGGNTNVHAQGPRPMSPMIQKLIGSPPVPIVNNEEILPSPPPLKVIVNDLLYFVHNSIKVNLEDKKIISIVSNFYNEKEFQDSLEILKKNFVLDIDPRSSSVHKVIQIVRWMKQLQTYGMSTDVKFLSERLSNIPPIFNNGPEDSRVSLDREKLKMMKDRVETNFKSILESLKDLKSEVIADLDHLAITSTELLGSEDNDMVDIIDLRADHKKLSHNRFMNDS